MYTCVCAYIFNYYLSFQSLRVCLGSWKWKEFVAPEVIFTLCCLRQKKRQYSSQNGAPDTHTHTPPPKKKRVWWGYTEDSLMYSWWSLCHRCSHKAQPDVKSRSEVKYPPAGMLAPHMYPSLVTVKSHSWMMKVHKIRINRFNLCVIYIYIGRCIKVCRLSLWAGFGERNGYSCWEAPRIKWVRLFSFPAPRLLI